MDPEEASFFAQHAMEAAGQPMTDSLVRDGVTTFVAYTFILMPVGDRMLMGSSELCTEMANGQGYDKLAMLAFIRDQIDAEISRRNWKPLGKFVSRG